MSEPNYQELAEAVGEFRHTLSEFDAKKADGKAVGELEQKVAKIEPVLDQFETIAQDAKSAKDAAEAQADTVTQLKEELESKGATFDEVSKRCDELEAEIARKTAQLQTGEKTYKTGDEYKAFVDWAKEGRGDMAPESKAMLRTDSAVSGGVLVTTEMESFITKEIVEIDPFRNLARVRAIGSKSIELPIRTSIPMARYEGEAETGTKSTSTYRNETLTPYRQTFTVPITMDMMQDSQFDMEAEISGDSLEAFAFGEGRAFVIGSGHKEPEGFLSHSGVESTASAVASTLSGDDILTMIGTLKVGYNASLVFNRKTLSELRKLRASAVGAGDREGSYLWLPGISGGAQNTFAGEPYTIMPSMPDIADNASPVAYGDWRRGYTIVDRTGMATTRDETTRKEEAIVEFTMHRWNTGQVTVAEAIKKVTIST